MENSTRIHYIDNIKIAITFLVVAHHAGQAYGNTGGVWLVSDSPQLSFLPSFFFLNAAYMMGFFFFVSGYFMYFSVAKKSTTLFLKDRFRRLGLPLLFFTFAIFLPLHYILSESKGNYFEFMYKYYVNKPPLAVGHLWFVASLLAYTLVFLLVKKPILASRTFSFASWFPVFFILFLSLVNYLVWQHYPIDHWETWLIPIEVAHLPQYFSLFLLGVIANKNKWLNQISMPVGLCYLGLGIVLFTGRNLVSNYLDALFAEVLIETTLCVGMILGSVVLFRKFLNFSTPILQFFSEVSFGIYLFHLLLVIAFQMLFKETQMSTLMKFILVSILGIITPAIFTYLLKKNKFLASIL